MKKLSTSFLFYLCLFFGISTGWSQTITPSAGNILYVIKGGAGTQTGDSWANAIAEFGTANNWARSNVNANLWSPDNPLQIWVAQGTYAPTFYTNPSGGGDYYFVLSKNVKIYGGFTGGESLLGQRDIKTAAATTVLAGRSTHAVVSAGDVGVAVLDGFTITGGYAATLRFSEPINGYWISGTRGGGIYCDFSSPTLSNLIVTKNSAYYGGAGLYASDSPLTLTNVKFSSNSTFTYGTVSLSSTQAPIEVSMDRVTMIGNSSGVPYNNHVLAISASNPQSSITVRLRNSAIVHNQTAGISLYPNGFLTMINSTVSGNHGEGVNILYEGAFTNIYNSIITGNTQGITSSSPALLNNVTVNHSLVQNWTGGGTGNLLNTTNPEFLNPAEGNYLLRPNSPAINAGNNANYPSSLNTDMDLVWNPRLTGDNVDLGAYEFTETPTPVGLINFTARADGSNARLDWQTTWEENSAFFEVEHSTNAKNFEVVKQIKAQGSSKTLQPYAYTHENLDASKIHYFRLKQLDRNGSYEYSAIRAVQLKGYRGLSLSARGNAGEIQVFIEYGDETLSNQAEVSVYNSMGQLLRQQSMDLQKGKNLMSLPARDLPSGIYAIRLTNQSLQAPIAVKIPLN